MGSTATEITPGLASSVVSHQETVLSTPMQKSNTIGRFQSVHTSGFESLASSTQFFSQDIPDEKYTVRDKVGVEMVVDV